MSSRPACAVQGRSPHPGNLRRLMEGDLRTIDQQTQSSVQAAVRVRKIEGHHGDAPSFLIRRVRNGDGRCRVHSDGSRRAREFVVDALRSDAGIRLGACGEGPDFVGSATQTRSGIGDRERARRFGTRLRTDLVSVEIDPDATPAAGTRSCSRDGQGLPRDAGVHRRDARSLGATRGRQDQQNCEDAPQTCSPALRCFECTHPIRHPFGP